MIIPVMFKKLDDCSIPVFYFSGLDANFYYASGQLVRVVREKIIDFETGLRQPQNSKYIEVKRLYEKAAAGKRRFEALRTNPYSPVCLTLYLNQTCPLDCVYCFSALDMIKEKRTISENAIAAAIRFVAANCEMAGLPLTVVFHGGGEPVDSWKQIDRVQSYLREIKDKQNIPVFRYLATNGFISGERARWLARSVDMVGLSCDGPSYIQISQRPTRKKSKYDSSFCIEQTGKILRDAGIPVQIRVTLTRQTFTQQVEICDYLLNEFLPQSIHVEPVYSGGNSRSDYYLREEDIEKFTACYVEAKSLALHKGSNWELSGTRLNDIHMAYCNQFRQVLQLIPGEIVVACFKTVGHQQSGRSDRKIGWYEPIMDHIVLDEEKICTLRNEYIIPEKCDDCFIKFQCTHNCPNGCPMDDYQESNFLCKLNQKISSADLLRFMSEMERSSDPITFISIGKL